MRNWQLPFPAPLQTTTGHLILRKAGLFLQQKKWTRMHSSRMRTGRLLTVCGSLLRGGGCLLQWGSGLGGLLGGGVSAPGDLVGGVSSRGGVCSQGGLVWGSVYSRGGIWSRGRGSAPGGVYPSMHWGRPPPPCGQTHACENITLAQLRCGWSLSWVFRWLCG